MLPRFDVESDCNPEPNRSKLTLREPVIRIEFGKAVREDAADCKVPLAEFGSEFRISSAGTPERIVTATRRRRLKDTDASR